MSLAAYTFGQLAELRAANQYGTEPPTPVGKWPATPVGFAEALMEEENGAVIRIDDYREILKYAAFKAEKRPGIYVLPEEDLWVSYVGAGGSQRYYKVVCITRNDRRHEDQRYDLVSGSFPDQSFSVAARLCERINPKEYVPQRHLDALGGDIRSALADGSDGTPPIPRPSRGNGKRRGKPGKDIEIVDNHAKQAAEPIPSCHDYDDTLDL